ncbi:hypothetical protein ABZ357_16895 [Streptomyces sp. NPDC005917]|uniref:hypothetical protein n=1 Tax=unclassified Streptomyces TaxID=2593676 RepID=UPI00340E1EAC
MRLGRVAFAGSLTSASPVAAVRRDQDSIYDDGGASSGLMTVTGYTGTLTLGVAG